MTQTIFGWSAKLTVEYEEGRVLDVTDCIEITGEGIVVNPQRVLDKVALERRVNERLAAQT